MNPHLPRLIELQAIDLRIAEIKHQRRLIPDRLAAARAPLHSATEALKQAGASVEALTKERRTCERDLDAQESHIEKMKARTGEIKTNKEYQAHLFEIEMANKKKGEVEEKILGLMETIEQLQREMAAAQARVREAEAAFEREQRLLNESDAALSKELAVLDEQQFVDHRDEDVRGDLGQLRLQFLVVLEIGRIGFLIPQFAEHFDLPFGQLRLREDLAVDAHQHALDDDALVLDRGG